jgi:hypothetical protein
LDHLLNHFGYWLLFNLGSFSGDDDAKGY